MVQERAITELTPRQVDSQRTAIVDFRPLEHEPGHLGYDAHSRLEELLHMPVASDDRAAAKADERTGQRAGMALGDIVGRSRVFTENLPQIKGALAQVAESRGVDVAEVEDDLVEILTASGIGRAMHRTLSRPLDGRNGVLHHIDERREEGVVVVVQENIANWSGYRQQGTVELLAGMSPGARANVTDVVYASSARQYKGPTELWRPEVRPYVTRDEETGNEVTNLTETLAAERIHIPQTQKILGTLGMEGTEVGLVTVETTKGTDVVNALLEQYGERMQNKLVVAVGNAPAGYTQLNLGLQLGRDLPSFDPAEQFVATTNEVHMVPPRLFETFTPAEKSRVQNAATGLNSFNGWLQTIVQTNQFMLGRQ